MNDNVFLETSIQIERLLGSDVRKKTIKFNLQGKRIFSSSVVYLKFKNTIINDINFIRSIVNSFELDKRLTLNDLQFKLYTKKYYPMNRIRGSFFIFSSIAKILNINDFRVQELLRILDNFQLEIEYQFFNIWSDKKNTYNIISEGCFLDNINIDKNKNWYTFNDNHIQTQDKSNIPEYLFTRIEELKAIRSVAQSTIQYRKKSENRKSLVLLDRIIDDPAYLYKIKSREYIYYMTDIIIALEVPDNTKIYTNDNDFKIICPAIGKEVFIENEFDKKLSIHIHDKIEFIENDVKKQFKNAFCTFRDEKHKLKSKLKGKCVEDLTELLFSSINGLSILGRNVQTESGEIDLLICNEVPHPFWREQIGSPFAVECKNLKKSMSTAQIARFRGLLEEKGIRVGIIIAPSGISGSSKRFGHHLLKNYIRDRDRIIIFLNYDDLSAIADGDDTTEIIKAAYYRLFLN